MSQGFSQALSNNDSLLKLLYHELYDALSVRVPRQIWAIPRERSAIDELDDWRAAGLTNKVERFFSTNLRMTEHSFQLLLGELDQHELMHNGEQTMRETHSTWRKLAAWLKWVGHNASFEEIGHFSGVARGSLGSQGRRGQGVLGKVTNALYDILVTGLGHKRDQGEIFFPTTREEMNNCMREFYRHARLPGVIDVPGSTGDAAAWNQSVLDSRFRRLQHSLPNVKVFANEGEEVEEIQPYVVANTAFRLSAHCVKCYERPRNVDENRLNAKIIRTRRLVECAFGRLKSKFKIAHANDKFGDKVMFPRLVTVLCALHNFLSREEGKEEALTEVSWCTADEQEVFQQDLWMAHAPMARSAAADAQRDARGTMVRESLCEHLRLSKELGLPKDQEMAVLFEQIQE